MAISKRSTHRNLQSRKNTGLSAAGLAHISISAGDSDNDAESRARFIRVPLAATFRFGWEFDKPYGSEFLEATFTGPQLLQIAAERGMLTESTTGERRVPKGIAAAASVIGGAA